MTYFSLWPTFFVTLFLLVLIMYLPVPIKKIESGTHIRYRSIDGMRGYLALAVVFTHSQGLYAIIRFNRLIENPSSMYSQLGTMAVHLFFMITSYLFWTKLLNNQGKNEWKQFYLRRLFRLAPLYWLAVFCVVLIVMIESGWQLKVSVNRFVFQIMSWLALGVLPLPDINNRYASFMILFGVTWTLKYEWFYYCMLFPLSFMARSFLRSLIFCLFLLFILYGLDQYVYVSPTYKQFMHVFFTFTVGMLCATVHHRYACRIKLNPLISCITALLILAVLLVKAESLDSLRSILYGLILFCVASGDNFFGVLTFPGSLKLGAVSYDIYLLQGLVFQTVLNIKPLGGFAVASPYNYWLMVWLICSVLMVFAVLAHRLIEKPGINIGNKIIKELF
ncbi:hypothetical protein COMNV_00751 [Commensalibacter sp. Nvir]|uniref:acyltransferase family protein n=1 Tax=Commensalibacter sp. Nvir TaxID=3069817 RepID=UPI002D6E0A72|nr:hypothetical protein COMNV_00751 [Commensalibacter sp. Nvir]